MQWFLKRLIVVVAVFGAFCVAGFLASSIEQMYQSLAASSAVFSVSFLSLIGGAVKLWYDIFG